MMDNHDLLLVQTKEKNSNLMKKLIEANDEIEVILLFFFLNYIII